MPNHSTQGTHGGTTEHGLIIGTIQASHIKGIKGKITLMPGGMLHGVRISSQVGDRYYAMADIEFEITDVDDIGLYGNFRKPSTPTLMVQDLLFLLPEPVPDFNAAFPYVFTWKADIEIGIRQLVVYHEFPRG